MKILITGGAGFIGTKICEKLKKEHEIIVLDNLSEQIHGKTPILLNGVNYVTGDVRNYNDWIKVLSFNPEIILHLASETGTGQSMDEVNMYTTTNIDGTAIMLELVNSGKYNVKKIILSSSRSVYGDNENLESNSNLDPKSVYGVTKLTQELLIKTSCKIPYTILRYQNVYGDGQSLNNPYTGIISIFSNKFKNNEEITIYDNGKPTRDFIYVQDIVDVTIECMTNDVTNNKIYNVGTGVETPIIDITYKLKSLINSDSKILITDYHRDGDIMFAKADTTKLKNDFKTQIKYDIDYGLTKFVEWFKKNN
jgi:dTDP-L-rhamnose 4-epimerase